MSQFKRLSRFPPSLSNMCFSSLLHRFLAKMLRSQESWENLQMLNISRTCNCKICKICKICTICAQIECDKYLEIYNVFLHKKSDMWQQSLWNWIWTDKRVWSVITQGKKKNILDKWKKSCEIVTCQLHTDGKLDRSLSGGGDWRERLIVIPIIFLCKKTWTLDIIFKRAQQKR